MSVATQPHHALGFPCQQRFGCKEPTDDRPTRRVGDSLQSRCDASSIPNAPRRYRPLGSLLAPHGPPSWRDLPMAHHCSMPQRLVAMPTLNLSMMTCSTRTAWCEPRRGVHIRAQWTSTTAVVTDSAHRIHLEDCGSVQCCCNELSMHAWHHGRRRLVECYWVRLILSAMLSPNACWTLSLGRNTSAITHI